MLPEHKIRTGNIDGLSFSLFIQSINAAHIRYPAIIKVYNYFGGILFTSNFSLNAVNARPA